MSANKNVAKWNRLGSRISAVSNGIAHVSTQLRRAQRANPSPIWNPTQMDIRDHFDLLDFDIRRNGIPDDERVTHLEASLPLEYRVLIEKHIVPNWRRDEGKAPDEEIEYSRLKQLLLLEILPPGVSTTSLRQLSDPVNAMKYDESFVRFWVRFTSALDRCTEARTLHDARVTKKALKKGKIRLAEMFETLGPLLLPKLQRRFCELKEKATSMDIMYTGLKAEYDTHSSTYGMRASAGSVDPHMPAPSLSSAAITGRPDQQYSRTISELHKHWNPEGQVPFFPSGQGLMMGPPAHGLHPQPPMYTPMSAVPVPDAEMAEYLKWKQERATKAAASRPTLPLDNETQPTHLAAFRSPRTLQSPPSQPPQGTATSDLQPSPYRDCQVKPHWSLGFDALPLALARAASDGEAYNPFCLWCKEHGHTSRSCTKTCARCGGAHGLDSCLTHPSQARCRFGHTGHVDATCISQICGLGKPRLPGRRALRATSDRNTQRTQDMYTSRTAPTNRVASSKVLGFEDFKREFEKRANSLSMQIAQLKAANVADRELASAASRQHQAEVEALKARLAEAKTTTTEITAKPAASTAEQIQRLLDAQDSMHKNINSLKRASRSTQSIVTKSLGDKARGRKKRDRSRSRSRSRDRNRRSNIKRAGGRR